jgi:type VI secretion system protein ImpG
MKASMNTTWWWIIFPLDYEIYAVNNIYASADGQRDDQTFRPFWSSWSGDAGNYGAYFSLRREQRVLRACAEIWHAPAISVRKFLSRWWMSNAPWQDNLRYISADALYQPRPAADAAAGAGHSSWPTPCR